MSFSLLISALTIPEAVLGVTLLNKVSDFITDGGGLLKLLSSSQLLAINSSPFSLEELSTLAEMVLHGLLALRMVLHGLLALSGGELDMLDFFLCCFLDRLSWLFLSNWFLSRAFTPTPPASSSIPPMTAKPDPALSQESPENLLLTSSPGFNVKSLKL